MKKPSEQDIQKRMNQVPRLHAHIPFDEVIVWVYAAPNPTTRFWLWRWLDKFIH